MMARSRASTRRYPPRRRRSTRTSAGARSRVRPHVRDLRHHRHASSDAVHSAGCRARCSLGCTPMTLLLQCRPFRHDRSPSAAHRRPRAELARSWPGARHAHGRVRRRGDQDRAARQGDDLRRLRPAKAASVLVRPGQPRQKVILGLHAEETGDVRRLVPMCDVVIENFRPACSSRGARLGELSAPAHR